MIDSSHGAALAATATFITSHSSHRPLPPPAVGSLAGQICRPQRQSLSSSCLHSSTQATQDADDSAIQTTTTTPSNSIQPTNVVEHAWQRTASQLQRLKQQQQTTSTTTTSSSSFDGASESDALLLAAVREYLQQPANALKELLKQRQLSSKGRKPDLARRLAQDDFQQQQQPTRTSLEQANDYDNDLPQAAFESTQDSTTTRTTTKTTAALPLSFAGLSPLSLAASRALAQAGFAKQPTPIQQQAIPRLALQHESLILYAPTGSGKTLAYLLPITERMWQQQDYYQEKDEESFAVILTPTRELAAQVAGIASILAPPGSVRLVTRPSNLLSFAAARKERGTDDVDDDDAPTSNLRLLVASAKTIQHSLYGDGKMPAPPTSKPEAQYFLRNVQYLVLDEVDRLLAVKKSRSDKLHERRHEKPAAILTAAMIRHTLGRVQIVAASATVGRTLRRELARVMGLPPQDCPPVVVTDGSTTVDEGDNDNDNEADETSLPFSSGLSRGRAVTIPSTVEHFVVPVDGTSTGKLLTAAYRVIQSIEKRDKNGKVEREANNPSKRILMVLTRGFGISTQNAIGALKHFKCQPDPVSLLDALQVDDGAGGGTDRLMETHRQVSGATGLGVAQQEETVQRQGYLLVTGEDTVRGIHLDGIDVVLVVGRPNGPDEYTHIAGRTGRAGKTGKVVTVVSQENAAALASWERMLECRFNQWTSEDLR